MAKWHSRHGVRRAPKSALRLLFAVMRCRRAHRTVTRSSIHTRERRARTPVACQIALATAPARFSCVSSPHMAVVVCCAGEITNDPGTAEYAALADDNFANWRLPVEGPSRPPGAFSLSLSLSDLRAFPARIHITRHDCVEGWSCIAKWTEVPRFRRFCSTSALHRVPLRR